MKEKPVKYTDSNRGTEVQSQKKTPRKDEKIESSSPCRTCSSEEEKVSIHQVKAGSSTVPIMVGNRKINARIDSGAEITILSSNIFSKLRKPPSKVTDVTMQMADSNATLKGFIVEPIQMKLGRQSFKERVYVAPIADDMLLGHDLLRHLGVLLDLQADEMLIDGERIPLKTNFGDGKPVVARVSVSKRVVVPPNSVVRMPCTLNTTFQDYYIEPVNDLKVLMPRTVSTAESDPMVCLVNVSDSYRTLKKGMIIGKAHEVSAFLEEPGGQKSDITCSENRPEVLTVNEEKLEGNSQISQTSQLPPHLKDMYEASIKQLNAEQCEHLCKLLCKYADVFAKHDYDLGNFTEIEHSIDTGDAKPIKQRMRRTPACFAGEEEQLLKKMLDAGIIQESVSEWASSPVLIRKRDGSVRWCIDYRALNNVTVKDTFPLPLIDDCLETLAGNVWFSKLDANSAYHQVLVSPEDRKKTAFLTRYGLFEHVRMGFGLTNSPATFSRVVSLVLRGLMWKTVLAFLDDILVMGKSFEEHLQNLEETLKRFRQYGLKLKPRKCILFQSEVEFLGRIVSSNQLKIAAEDVKTVLDWPVPTSSKEVERFLGLANYHRAFIKKFADIAQPLYNLTGKNKFKWDQEEQNAFQALKNALVEPPVLALPNNQDKFILDTDASDTAIGAELIQVQNGEEKVVAYSSFTLSPEQRKYCTTRKELLSIVRFTRQFRHYLLGRVFTVRTDHSSLTWLLRFKDPQGQLARWMEELSQYNMVIQHRPGTKHGNADALSRIPDPLSPCPSYVAGLKPSDLPCGGCAYCTRAHNQWGSFIHDIDEAVSLTTLPAKESVVAEVKESDGSKEDNLDLEAAPITTEGCTDLWDVSLNVGRVDFGASAAHFEIVTPVQGDRKICASTVTVAPEATSQNPACWGFSFAELEAEQAKDKDLRIILDWLSSDTVPDEGNLFLSSPAAKFYWVNKEIFQLVDGVLFKKSQDTEDLQLVVPDSLKEKALEWHHDIPSAGHQGIARTKAKLKEKFFWFRLSQDVESYVLSCSVCNKNKKNKCYGRVPLTEFQAGAPMERVHIDFIGPLPKTENGNEHCLMMVDQFTKWVECVPLPSQRAEVTAKAAIDEFFSRFGFPLQLFSDQGRNFESKLFEALCKALQIHKARTTPYRPSSNGQVERFNRTLMDAVRCFLGKSQNKWDQHVQQIAGAIRASVNRSTGFTPNKLMLGREVNTPAQLMFPNPKEKHNEPETYVAELLTSMKTAHETARSTLQTSQKRMKRDYDLRVLLRPYAEGDVVYLLDTATLKGKSRKLSSPWKGPAVILKKISGSLYRIKLRNAVFIANHDRMMPCRDRQLPDWIIKFQKSGQQLDPEPDVHSDDTPYCVCRKPYDGRFMIQCDFCEEWYHGSCVNITATDALDIDKYKCRACKENVNKH